MGLKRMRSHNQPRSFLPLGVGCWLRRNVLEPLLPDASVVRHWLSQLLMRSQGPRGPTAIDCPVTTPNQSLGDSQPQVGRGVPAGS
jgi:hypothetical protein